jgi:hypothetical protein
VSAQNAADLPVGTVVVHGDLSARKMRLDFVDTWLVGGLGWFTDGEIDDWITDPNYPARVSVPTDHSPTS